MSLPATIPPFWRRVLHILRTDLTRERGWLSGWLLLLAARALDHWDAAVPPRLGNVLDSVVAVAGLALVVKLVRADAPGSDVTASLTRPVGRGALWTAKLGFILLALWLPFLLMHALAWRAFGLGPASWAAVLAITGLPSLAAAFLAGWLASLRVPKTVLAALFPVVLLILAFPVLGQITPFLSRDLDSHLDRIMPDHDTPEGSLLRCRMILFTLAALPAFGLGWLLASLNRRSLPAAMTALLTGIVAASCWSWDWQRLPTLAYTDTKPILRVTTEPAPGDQALWPGLRLSGLPASHAAAVVALAPVMPGQDVWPPKESYSDFTTIEKNGQPSLRERWMCADHAQRLSTSFPDHLIWVGQVDRERPHLRGIVSREQNRHPDAARLPWRLRLLIHEWKAVPAGSLQALSNTPSRLNLADAGLLNFKDRILSSNQLRFDTRLIQRFPRLRFSGSPDAVRIHGMEPPLNLLMTARAPMLDEVIVAHGQNVWSEVHHEFWAADSNSYMTFNLPLPVIHMDMTGLDLSDWMRRTEITLWLPQERGIVDLEINAGAMERALR